MDAMDMTLEKNVTLNAQSAADFPAGYTFRSITREEGDLWEKVMDAAFGDYQAGTFEQVMVDNYSYLPERVHVLFDETSTPCGTATAWSQPWRWGENEGFIIFVGVIPSHRGHGLGTSMVLQLCDVIAHRGEQAVLLNVDSDNLPAIKSYLNAGFLPRLTAPGEAQKWSEIFQQLNVEPATYNTELRPPMDNPHPPRPYLLELRAQGLNVL
ncbi:GNAT family N-acetyltransferase [Paenibacillus albus]|uniref:GNAT family N-acetyltransferase n=1 Tax=Paenibacillus albus TaxID=2495582 RepID=A0A3S9A0V5_9BACL|nr:GNAT family N-acetyltransferase [Paenibacillus albus]AZN39312.1 GNAT family N-acetyltransferase [Paenibacillus albus]